MAVALYDYYPPPPEPIYIHDVTLLFKYTDTTNEWLKTYISAKIVGLNNPELILYNIYVKHELMYRTTLYNSEFEDYIDENHTFTNDFIAGVGVYGSGLVGTYRKYEATGICGLISDNDYTATDVTANMTVFDIDAKYENGRWTADTDYELDKNIDNQGLLEKYWNYLSMNSEYNSTEVSDNYFTYIYDGYSDKEVDLSIGLLELVVSFLTETLSWTEYFPFDVALGWGAKEGESAINELLVNTPTALETFTTYLKIYETKTIYIYNEDNYQLPIMLFYIGVE